MKTAIKIPVYEYERGWGSKIDDYMVCLTSEDKDNFIKGFNSDNDKPQVPDWYMIAKDEPSFIELTDSQYELLKIHKRIFQSILLK